MAFKFKDLMVNVLPAQADKVAGAACPTLSAGGGPAAAAACPTLSAPGQAAPEAAAGTAPQGAQPVHCPTLSALTTFTTAWICPTLSMTVTWAAGICPTLSATAGYAALCPTLSATVTGTLQAQSPEMLAALRQQLQQALAQLDQPQAAHAAMAAANVADTGLPQTVEEAEDLERRLRGALDELQQHKKALQAARPKKPRK
jgi:hypothetical protein